MAAKVLLVEDSKFLRVSTERALTKAGFQVVSAADGEEGLRLAREQAPNINLLDVMLQDQRTGCSEGVEEGSLDGGHSGDDAHQFVAEKRKSDGERRSGRIFRKIRRDAHSWSRLVGGGH